MNQHSKSILQKEVLIPKEKEVSYIESDNISTTFNTGFVGTDIKIEEDCKLPIDDSIIDSINTGFGETNVIIKDCPKYKIPLFKENYLNEFESDTEKVLIRHNIDVYSKKEVNDLISHIVVGDVSGNFVTKDNLDMVLEDFVSSTLRSYALYDIPNNLFPL